MNIPEFWCGFIACAGLMTCLETLTMTMYLVYLRTKVRRKKNGRNNINPRHKSSKH